MKAVVMAGGEGTRLRPLTSHRPKPLSPVLNKPIMEHIILLLKEHGITDIVVTLHYLADEIEGYFGDGSEWGVNLSYSVEDIPLGTAGSVKNAQHLLNDDSFVIVSGDALTDIDITRAVEYHCQKQSLATIVLSHVPNPLEFGVVITDDEGRIRRFLEKPSWGEVFSDTVNTGMYILEPAVFDYMEEGKSYDWSQDIFPQILREEKPLFGYVMPDYWCDIGNLNQYREAQYTVLDGQTKVKIGGQSIGNIHTGEGAHIDANVQLVPPIVIGKNVKINSGALVGPYTVVGDNCIIEPGAVVHRSILWDNVYVGQNSRLSACTVCSHVIIGQDCLIQEGAVIGERCRIDRDSTVRTQIKLWPDKIIEAGSIVTMSLIWGQKWLGALFRNLGVTGIANIEITPDFATKLGSCYGAYLKRGSTVITGRDSGLGARMIKRAFISGLMSVGCNVLDMRSMPLPIMRHTVRGAAAAGGMYVRLSPNNPRQLLIEFMDQNGIYLSKAAERKVETIFFREDFNRADLDQIGDLEFAGRAIEEYQEDFLRHIRVDLVSDRRLKIVADFGNGRVSNIFPTLLGKLGCDVISLNAYPDASKAPHSKQEQQSHLENLKQIVQTLSADLGVLFENDGERLTLVDDMSRIIEGDKLLMLYSVMYARTHARARIGVPVTAPRRIEAMVELHGGWVHRTKTDVRSLMSVAAGTEKNATRVDMSGDTKGGFIFGEFIPAYDSMFAFCKLLEMLGVSDLRVSEIISHMPEVHIVRSEVKCPWEMKGRVMRELAHEYSDKAKVDLIDGIKIYDNEDWSLILPDASDPCFHIYAESDSNEKAENMIRFYSEKIQRIIS